MWRPFSCSIQVSDYFTHVTWLGRLKNRDNSRSRQQNRELRQDQIVDCSYDTGANRVRWMIMGWKPWRFVFLFICLVTSPAPLPKHLSSSPSTWQPGRVQGHLLTRTYSGSRSNVRHEVSLLRLTHHTGFVYLGCHKGNMY